MTNELYTTLSEVCRWFFLRRFSEIHENFLSPSVTLATDFAFEDIMSYLTLNNGAFQ